MPSILSTASSFARSAGEEEGERERDGGREKRGGGHYEWNGEWVLVLVVWGNGGWRLEVGLEVRDLDIGDIGNQVGS